MADYGVDTESGFCWITYRLFLQNPKNLPPTTYHLTPILNEKPICRSRAKPNFQNPYFARQESP